MSSDSINPFKDNMVGRTLAGRYRIVRKLATGGMGVVYLARAEGAAGFAKPVVVKLVLPNYAENREFSGMFIREAMILSHLQDPGIVGVVEFSEEGGCYLMVLEYVNGYQLREWNKYRKSTGRLIPTAVCIHIMTSVLDALHYAHTLQRPDGSVMQVIHRDISPGNIMIDMDGRARVVDFGIALVTDATFGYLTQTDSFKGKLSYAAPELFKNEKASVLSDVYACGVSLHEILLGRSDFRTGNHVTTLSRVLSHAACSVLQRRPDAPKEIDRVLGKSMAKNPAERYQSAAEFAEALRKIYAVNVREQQIQLAELVRRDFSEEMAEFLGVESLDSRDRAWRHPSDPAPSLDATNPAGAPIQKHEKTSPYAPKELTPGKISATGKTSLQPTEERALQRVNSSVKLAVATFGIAAFLGLGVLAFVGFSRDDDSGNIVVVQSPIAETGVNEATAARKQVPTSVGKNAPEAALEMDTSALSPTSKSSRNRRNKNIKVNNNVSMLTQAFKKQENKIGACFKNYAVSLEGKPNISIRFQLEKGGKVNTAAVSPASLSKTALGMCLEKVAKQTRFPEQKKTISFRIPVKAWRVQK